MSGAAKVRRTEVTIKEGNKTKKFELPSEVGRNLLNLILSFINTDNKTVEANEIFPSLKDPSKRIGVIFRGIRFKHNLTQNEVAKKLGIDQSDVSKIEKGKRPIGKALAKKIEHEFGIDYRRFL